MQTETTSEVGRDMELLGRLVEEATPFLSSDDPEVLHTDVFCAHSALSHALTMLGMPEPPLHGLTPHEETDARYIVDFVASVMERELSLAEEWGFEKARTDAVRDRVLRLLIQRFAQQL